MVDYLQYAVWLLIHIVFPNPDRGPTGGLKGPHLALITFNVGLQLGQPEITPSPREHIMLWTTMPEAAVNEDCDTMSKKNEVRPPPRSPRMKAVSKAPAPKD